MPTIKPSNNPTTRRRQIADAVRDAVTPNEAERGTGIVSDREFKKLTALVKTPEDKAYLKDLFVAETRRTPDLSVTEAAKAYFGGSVGGVELPTVTLVKPTSDKHLTNAQLLMRRAMGAINGVMKETSPSDRSWSSHTVARNASKDIADALMAIDPKGADAKRLKKALGQLLERAGIQPGDRLPTVHSGSGWVYVAEGRPTTVKDRWAANTVSWLVGEMRGRGRPELLPPEFLR